MTEDNKRYHLIINVDEKYAIVNALAFYHAHHIQGALMDEDEREQYMLAFQEDGPSLVDSLATKVANTLTSPTSGSRRQTASTTSTTPSSILKEWELYDDQP